MAGELGCWTGCVVQGRQHPVDGVQGVPVLSGQGQQVVASLQAWYLPQLAALNNGCCWFSWPGCVWRAGKHCWGLVGGVLFVVGANRCNVASLGSPSDRAVDGPALGTRQRIWHSSCLLLAGLRVCSSAAVGAQRTNIARQAGAHRTAAGSHQGLWRVLLGRICAGRRGVVRAGFFTTSCAVCCGVKGMRWGWGLLMATL